MAAYHDVVGTDQTFQAEVAWLLNDLCAEMAFCLPAGDRDALTNAPPRRVDAFTDAVFAAEGMDPSLHKQLRRAVRNKIEQRWATS